MKLPPKFPQTCFTNFLHQLKNKIIINIINFSLIKKKIKAKIFPPVKNRVESQIIALYINQIICDSTQVYFFFKKSYQLNILFCMLLTDKTINKIMFF
jgi:hypothetical protein